jgi:para-aminobenzoate synthetase component 1
MSIQINVVDIAHSPDELFLMIPKDSSGLVFFSSDGSEGSRFSLLAMNPVEQIRYDGEYVWRNDNKSIDDLDTVLNELIFSRKTQQDSHLPFLGGLIGSIDFEYGYEVMGLQKANNSDQQVYWNVYNHLLIYDHLDEQWFEVSRGNTLAFPWEKWASSPTEAQGSLNLIPSWNYEEYRKIFDQVHENIRKGEIYQACLSFPFTGPRLETPRQLFIDLIKKNPAPMAAYLEQGDRHILSLSPERFLYWDGVQIETKPIKGTRPRAASPEDDLRLQQDLLSNEKEKAELNMITDLLRNDLAQVSKPGTVKVLQHQALQECPTVWHTYSHIVAETLEEISAWDIIRKTFPGGSISGCPKRRALEILRKLEHSPRGIYTGCIGYISDHGQMDLNIAIRTLENNRQGSRAGFGGGIVFDSQAEQEYQECYDKARIFLTNT